MNTNCTAGAMAPDAAPADPRAVPSEYVRTRTVTPALLPSLDRPGSTTHLSSSGVAGTMAAHRSGLQWGTIRSLLMAWVPTLPAAILLSGSPYWLFVHLS